MMEAVRTSETPVNFYETTRRNIPEGCCLLPLNAFANVNLQGYIILRRRSYNQVLAVTVPQNQINYTSSVATIWRQSRGGYIGGQQSVLDKQSTPFCYTLRLIAVCCLLECLLTPRSTVILEKLTIDQLVKKFSS
jgi:hypothetical protein